MRASLKLKTTQLANLLATKPGIQKNLTWSRFGMLHLGYQTKRHRSVCVVQIKSKQDIVKLMTFFAKNGLCINLMAVSLLSSAAKWFVSADDNGNVISVFSIVEFVGFTGTKERYDIFDVWLGSIAIKEEPAFAKAIEAILVGQYQFNNKMMFAHY